MAKRSTLAAASGVVDPTLDALFAGSAGPVTAAPKSRYAELPPWRTAGLESSSDVEEDEENPEASKDEVSGASVSEDDSADESESQDAASDDGGLSEDNEAAIAEILESAVASDETSQKKDRKRKRKQRDEYDDLESRHLHKLTKEDAEPAGKRLKGENGFEDASEDSGRNESSADDIPMHESLSADPSATELERASRTVFLSNVSTEAISSSKAKRALLAHLSSILDKSASPRQTIESIRFRSTAFSTAAIPKRAAYIKKSLMESTTKSSNAYVVFSVASAVRAAVVQLNGTVVLDRHLRVDSVAHPSPVDHRRCIFVGNLGFVDDESVLNVKTDEGGKEVTEKRKRTKAPMDVEEGLWRVFGKSAGKVESVRVVRDPVTRVGKGFAYVQFYDANGVEAALPLSGKKFPPMLPRELRVTRCKAPHKTARAAEAKHSKAARSEGDQGKKRKDKGRGKGSDYVPKPTAEGQTLAGRAAKLFGRSGAAKTAVVPGGNGRFAKRDRGRAGPRAGEDKENGRDNTREAKGSAPIAIKSPEDIIFEGRRASAKDGKPKDLKFKGAKKSVVKKKLPNEGRGGVRAAKWRAHGGN